MTALHCACDNGHRDVVELLLDYGIDVDQLGRGWDSGMDIPPSTGLIYACRSGHQDVVQLLLDRDADDSWTGDGEKTALLTACGSGHRGVVLTQAWAGTFATELLGFMGAEIIQVEVRKRLDLELYFHHNLL